MTRCATLKIFLPYKIHVNWDSEVYQCCQKLSDDKGWEVFLKLISAWLKIFSLTRSTKVVTVWEKHLRWQELWNLSEILFWKTKNFLALASYMYNKFHYMALVFLISFSLLVYQCDLIKIWKLCRWKRRTGKGSLTMPENDWSYFGKARAVCRHVPQCASAVSSVGLSFGGSTSQC